MAKVTITFEDLAEGVHVEAYQATLPSENEELSKSIQLAHIVGEYLRKHHSAAITHSRTFQD